MKRYLTGLVAVCVVSACSATPPASSPVATATAPALPPGSPTPAASTCNHYIGSFGTVNGLHVPAHGYMGMSDDGWCRLTIRFNIHHTPFVPPISVTARPAHGNLMIIKNGITVYVFYKPDVGFSGTDHLAVLATFPDHVVPVPIDITVKQ